MCPHCEVEARRKITAKRKSKKASKEKSREEKYLRLSPWLQEESPADIHPIYGVADGPKCRTARHGTARDGTRKRVTFEDDGSREKVIIGTGAKENPSKDSDLRSRNTRLDHRSSRERSSGEKSRRHNFVDATNQGGRKEAAIREFVQSKNEQGKAAKGKAAKQSNVEQKWRGLLSQLRSFAKTMLQHINL